MLFHATTDSDRSASQDLFADLPSLGNLEPAPQNDDPMVAGMEALLLYLPQATAELSPAIARAEPETLLQCARACMTRYLRLKRQAKAAAALAEPERAPRPHSDGSRGWYKRRRDRTPANRDRKREVFRSTGVALGDHDLSDGAFRTGCQYQALCGAKGWCETTWCAMAKLRGVDRKTIQRHNAELIGLGLMTVGRARRSRHKARVVLAEVLIPPKKPMPRKMRVLVDGCRSRRPADQDVTDSACRKLLWNQLSPEERAMARRRRRCGTRMSHSTASKDVSLNPERRGCGQAGLAAGSGRGLPGSGQGLQQAGTAPPGLGLRACF